jgi:cyclic dehypoxanthinyl futalosine synthase
VDEVVDGGPRRGEGATTTLCKAGLRRSRSRITSTSSALKQNFPDVCVHLWSPSEIRTMAEISGLSVREVLRELWNAGQRTIPGGGAEILVERVRKRISPKKATAEQWLEVMRTAHEIGYRTTATMMYGAETDPGS